MLRMQIQNMMQRFLGVSICVILISKKKANQIDLNDGFSCMLT